MENKAKEIVAALEKQIQKMPSIEEHPLLHAEEAIKATWASLESLKAAFLLYPVTTKKEEIHFFKRIKPQLTSKLIYYSEIHKIERYKPTETNKTLKKYYSKVYKKTCHFFRKNKEGYAYYKAQNTHFDKKYFLRRAPNHFSAADYKYIQADPFFSTPHDYTMAQCIAYENLQKYLVAKRSHLKNNNLQNTRPNQKPYTIKWTASKVALVELVYALHTEGVLNHGNLSLNETAKNIEAIFNIQLGQINRIFTEIKARKTIEQTHFLNTLKQTLIKKIQTADEK